MQEFVTLNANVANSSCHMYSNGHSEALDTSMTNKGHCSDSDASLVSTRPFGIEHSLLRSDSSFSSLDDGANDMDGRAMSPVSGFKLRLSKSDLHLHEGNLSSLPTVKQTERRILAPRPRHSSPLQPIRLFAAPGIENQMPSAPSPASLDPQIRKIQIASIPRHLRQQKRDFYDTPSGRYHAELRELAFSEPSARPPRPGSRRPSQEYCTPVKSFHHDFFDFVQIGRGSFGNVYRCTKKVDLRHYAVKEITTEFRSERERERALKEIYALVTQCDNINVVRYHNAWEENGKLYIQTELCSGTLASLKKTFGGALPEELLRDVLGQIATGLAHMHEEWNMVHLDIKPENIYTTDNGLFKLGDLGLASLGDKRELAEEGDKRYLSREMLQRADCDLFKVDIFALGVSMYELASSQPLPSEGDAYHALRDGSAPPLDALSGPFQELIMAMMHPDPAGRPSAQELSRHALLRPAAWPCLAAQPAMHPNCINVLPALADESRLEWMQNQANRLERDVEFLAARLAAVTAEARRWEEELGGIASPA